MRISNETAMTAIRYAGVHQNNAARSVMRLSTGKRINSAADDPAGMAISQKMQARLRGLRMVIRSEEARQGALDAAYSESMHRSELLNEMRDIALRMSSDTLTQEEKNGLTQTYLELLKELSGSVYDKTGMEIVVAESGALAGEVMFKHGEKVYYGGKWIEISALPQLSAADDIDVGAADGKTLGTVTKGIIEHVDGLFNDNVMSAAQISGMASAMNSRLDRLLAEEEAAAAALSNIEDVDMAKEMLYFCREKLLSECAVAAAVQANAVPERVLYLLENM